METMMKEKVVEVQDVSMHFNLMEEKVDSIKEYFMKLIKGKLLYNDFIALQHVSFSIYKGEIVGLVGFNGAGKSTMLKILAGVLSPTSGKVMVKGKIAPLIEVGAGFDPELTARENIYLNGAILGHSAQYINDHFDEIIDFAELKDFVDVPVKNFSSGMYARLGFSIATMVKPDILIVDEVLSVGDYRFQEKCEERIRKMIQDGVTIILVSHDIHLIENLCTKVIWLDHGVVKDIGKTEIICNEYKNAI
jgi:ABC-2 type transport system ATP-binding protein